MMSPPSMTQMSSRIDCIALKRTKCGSFSLRTTSRYLVTRAGGRRGESRFFLGGLGAGREQMRGGRGSHMAKKTKKGVKLLL